MNYLLAPEDVSERSLVIYFVDSLLSLEMDKVPKQTILFVFVKKEILYSVVATNTPPLCLVLAITLRKWGPLIKNSKTFYKTFCIILLKNMSHRAKKINISLRA